MGDSNFASSIAKIFDGIAKTLNWSITMILQKIKFCMRLMIMPNNKNQGDWLKEGIAKRILALKAKTREKSLLVLTKGGKTDNFHNWSSGSNCWKYHFQKCKQAHQFCLNSTPVPNFTNLENASSSKGSKFRAAT